MDLKTKYGQWALVTGASSGIGEEFSIRLAQYGMNVILVARREDRLTALSDELKEKYKIDTLVVPLDLSNEGFLPKLANAVGNREVGIFINNAGYGSTGEFVDNDPQFEANMVRLNCVAPTILTHHFVRPMKERGKGAIIFLGSIAAFQPTPMMTTYSATKVFNRYMGDALWYELKKYGIDVLTLNPGGTNTEFQRIATIDSGPLARTPGQVVSTAMKSLGKKMSVVDGTQNKFTAVFSKILPLRLVVNISGYVATKMYNTYKNVK